MLSPDVSTLTANAINRTRPHKANALNQPQPHSTRACRCCEIPLTGPAHHALCLTCWHWTRHAQATRMAARWFAREARP